jgi:hypothetical protein
LIALGLIAIMGVVSLGIEGAYLLAQARRLQTVADNAAYSGAVAILDKAPADPHTEAAAIIAGSSYASGATPTINIPPLSGPYAGNASAVEVILSQPQSLALAGLVYSGPFTIERRAVAAVTYVNGDCALILDPTASGSFSVSNNANVSFTGCGLAVNSASTHAIKVQNNASVTGSTASIVGSYTASDIANNSQFNFNTVNTNSSPVEDPYASRSVPTPGGCSAQNTWGGSSVATIQPGTYCNGLSFTNNAQITMAPGVYIINQGNFTVANNVVLSGTGVSIVLTSSTGSNYGTISFGNNTQINLSAMTTGPTAGMVVFENPAAPLGNTTIKNNTGWVLNGALYLPKQNLTLSNNNATNTNCMQVISNQLTIKNNVTMNLSCSDIPISGIGSGTVRVVE